MVMQRGLLDLFGGATGGEQGGGGLLGNPLLNLGVGILAHGGRGTTLGEALAGGMQFAQKRELAGQKSQMMRARLAEAKRQREAGGALRELISSMGGGDPATPGAPATGLSPQQQAVLSAIAGVDPGAAAGMLAQQVFPQRERGTSLIRNLEAAGIDPASPEGRKIILDTLQRPEVADQIAAVQAQQASINAQLAQERLMTTRREREQAERSEVDQRREGERAVLTGVNNVREMSRIVDDLEGTFATPGAGGEDLRRFGVGAAAFLGEQLGLDVSEQRRLAANVDRLRQLATTTGIDQLEVLRGLGVVTDTKFNVLVNLFTDPRADPIALRLGLADVLDAQFAAADRLGLDLPNREELEELQAQLRQSRQPAAAQRQSTPQRPPGLLDDDAPAPGPEPRGAEAATQAAPAQIGRMSLAEVTALDPAELTPEQVEAMDKRLRELGY